MDKPKIKEDIDLENIINICQEYIDFIDNDSEYHEDKADDYIYRIAEVALKEVLGDKVFDYINERQD